VLFATNSSATKVQKKIKDSPRVRPAQGAAPLFEQNIRHVEAAAVEARLRGKVPQELRTSSELRHAAAQVDEGTWPATTSRWP
jgi:chromosome partitioning protein